ncbi:MAG: glycosyltransferase [Lachnospiraceae bacterium]|nr:glycosyltransferase [Lachnospiraceae bacterium]
MREKEPLVSIMIPNYNYGHYLRQCLNSVYEQTYQNIEVVFLDNCSKDDSLAIAKEYIPKGLKVCRNPYNIFTDSYKLLSNVLINGKYMMLLPSDDYIKPDFVKKCVQIMEEYDHVGYVHVEREFVDEQGEVIAPEEPFYNCSFVAPGEDVLPIYMMTTVAHPAQAMYRRNLFEKIGGFAQFVEHLNADRGLWFYLSTVSDYAYIKEKLACVRRGRYTETAVSITNFQHPVAVGMTLLDFIDTSKALGNEKAAAREKQAKQKFAVEMLDYSMDMLLLENYEAAEKYLLFCEIFYRGIVTHEHYIEIAEMIRKRTIDKEAVYKMKSREGHHRNYEPPENYRQLQV